jgi:RNA polymerase sigma-70 factor (ECF subfamily)
MSNIAQHDAGLRAAGVSTRWDMVWEWLARPMRYTAVRNVRVAAQAADGPLLASLLRPDVAVVVAVVPVVEGARPEALVVRGPRDSAALLIHGMAPRSGISVIEHSVNGQAGLVMTSRGRPSAMITVDFAGRLVSMVWVALRPELLAAWDRG